MWQALASERELVLALLYPDSSVDTGSIALRFANETDVGKPETDLTFVLDRIFEGVCRPFKVRVEQVLQSQPNLIISYKLSNTLEFYSHTVSSSTSQIFFFFYNFFVFVLCFFQLKVSSADIKSSGERNSSV